MWKNFTDGNFLMVGMNSLQFDQIVQVAGEVMTFTLLFWDFLLMKFLSIGEASA